MTRYAMVRQSKGVWDLVKAKDGPWMLFDDHEQITAEQRQEIARLEDLLKKLDALEAAGVDNWEGYGDAMELMAEAEKEHP